MNSTTPPAVTYGLVASSYLLSINNEDAVPIFLNDWTLVAILGLYLGYYETTLPANALGVKFLFLLF